MGQEAMVGGVPGLAPPGALRMPPLLGMRGHWGPEQSDNERNRRPEVAALVALTHPGEFPRPCPSGGEATMEWKVEGRWPMEWTAASTAASGSAGSQENGCAASAEPAG
ncbi:hypothetical protein N9L68_08225 [bacterium]|nr:hypothetical protein [bacterium]